MSARDVNITSRQATSHAVQLAARAARRPLDLPRLLRADPLGLRAQRTRQDIKQIEVVRGPASAVWGANALTGVVNIITKTPRESPGRQPHPDRRPLQPRRRLDARDEDADRLRRRRVSYARAPNDTLVVPALRRLLQLRPVPAARRAPSRRATHPLDPVDRDGRRRLSGGSRGHLARASGPSRTRGTSQPKVDLRVDQELSQRRPHHATPAATPGTEGIVHTGIGPFDLAERLVPGLRPRRLHARAASRSPRS